MAIGALDANGVWIYGEDDPASPVSDLLNLGMDSVSDAVGDAKARLTALEASLTAWTTITLAAAYTADAGNPPKLRVTDGWCELAGVAVKATDVTSTLENFILAGGAPAAVLAGSGFDIIAGLSSATLPLNGVAKLNPRSDGGIRILATIAGGRRVTLDGARYRVA